MTTHRVRAAAVALAATLLTAGAQAQPLPRKAPEYSCSLPDGKPLALSQFSGKPRVMAFIFTYCQHCQKAVGILSGLQKQYAARGLQVMACAIDEGAKIALPGFIRNFTPAFPVGYAADKGASAVGFMQIPPDKVPLMPLLAFIDRQGMIRGQLEGHDLEGASEPEDAILRKQIEKLFVGTGPGKK